MTEPVLAFRLTENRDPEERLEEAALWKALHDEYGDAIVAIGKDDDGGGLPVFGRAMRFRGQLEANPVTSNLPYWNDPAFLARCRRSFKVLPFERVEEEVLRLHAAGMDAFLKSTKQKHAIFRIPAGETVAGVMEDMAYSFIDGGPAIMVQQSVAMEFEHRFFCVGREIVTWSPVQWSLTPIDFPLAPGAAYRTPSSRAPEKADGVAEALLSLAEEIAAGMEFPHAAIDCAIVDGTPGCIEMNPMQLGMAGLYACDVRALARASRSLLQEAVPSPSLKA